MLRKFVAALALLTALSTAGTATAGPDAFSPPGFSGGTYATPTGESVRVFSSPAFAADPTSNQRWADFVDSMPHGPEISTVTIYLAPLDQVGTVCGLHTLGCYSPEDKVIFASGEDVPGRATVQSILAHEYGHHIANSRRNTPWSAEDYGTKRWATYENVCAKARTEKLFPGDEGDHYKLNSGEVFAETYRVYVEQKLGLPASPWIAVDAGLQPDAEALDLVAHDVADPWQGPTVTTRTGDFRAYAGDARTIRFGAPLDGVITLTLAAPAGAAFDAHLFDTTGRKLLAQTTPGARAVKTIRYVACGERAFELRVLREHGFGSFTLQLSRP
jgi:hypothetical protein